jgi:two-component system, OmpR family, KDP operon response regulator KdpE
MAMTATEEATETILVVDDEEKIQRLVVSELKNQGFKTAQAKNGREAVQEVDRVSPDLVILDIMLPDYDGMEVLRKIRERSEVPVIFLSAKGADMDKIRGLELGADDYIAKPFNPEELAARVRAVLRRRAPQSEAAPAEPVAFGDVIIDMHRRRVFLKDQPVALSRTEWRLLEQLALHSGRILVHEELLSKVWGPEYRDDVQYLRVWISRLRQKLEPTPSEPRYIKTMPGIGYILEAGAS